MKFHNLHHINEQQQKTALKITTPADMADTDTLLSLLRFFKKNAFPLSNNIVHQDKCSF